ncbi:MAG TPA: hypothetical protein ENN81_01240, partial [Phycisphaerales bacterium]|nr:hypothetical protein [Phycisphaerales bacterium]
MTHIRRLFFIPLAATLLAVSASSAQAVGTTAIDKVRTKTSLTAEDTTVIDNFLADAVREIVNAPDFASIAKVRSDVLTMSRSQHIPYVQQFIEAARRHITAGMSQALTFPADRGNIIRMNLLILVATLEDIRLLDLPLKTLGDRSPLVRYWSARCFANDSVIKILSAGTANARLAQSAAEEMTKHVNLADAATLRLMAEYGGRVPGPAAQNLLTKVADARIAQYGSWKVDAELIDAAILKYLAVRLAVATTPQAKSELAMTFGQLYAHVFQRYLKGKAVIGQAAADRLSAVLVEVEDKALKILLGQPQTTIRRAIETQSDSELLQEYTRLFGADAQGGVLTQKFNIQYTRQGQPARQSPYP